MKAACTPSGAVEQRHTGMLIKLRCVHRPTQRGHALGKRLERNWGKKTRIDDSGFLAGGGKG